MKMRSLALAAGAALGLVSIANAADLPVKAPPAPPPTPFFIVNDTSVSFVWFPNATDPGVSGSSNTVPGGVAGQGNTFSRWQGSIDHFDVWALGSNFIHAEFNQYGNQDPSFGVPGAQGSREFFAIARSTLGLNELTHSKMFSNYFIKNVSIEVGGNAGVQDDFLDSHTTVGMIGLQWSLNVPGTVVIALMVEKEYTRNMFDACGPGGFGVVNGPAPNIGINTCAGGIGSFSGNREFDTTWRVETLVREPLEFFPAAPLTFQNILNVIGPKGTGISVANCLAVGCFGPLGALANNTTKTEVFEDVRLILDASKLAWNKPGIWDAFVGYRYWYNKFGTDHNAALFSQIAPGTSIESTVFVGTTYHFK
jgi:opacity protein-like surface antigen